MTTHDSVVPFAQQAPMHVELLLFNPARHVVFGMAIFVSDDAKLLRSLLRGHGEWWDNASVWAAGLVGSDPQLTSRVALPKGPDTLYARRLIRPGDAACRCWKFSEPCWTRETTRQDMHRILPRAWLVQRDPISRLIPASAPDVMARQAGFWFPCDGAIGLDRATLPAETSSTSLVERILGDTALVAHLAERAENCFLFHVHAAPPRSMPTAFASRIEWGRNAALSMRQGRLFKATLELDGPCLQAAEVDHDLTEI